MIGLAAKPVHFASAWIASTPGRMADAPGDTDTEVCPSRVTVKETNLSFRLPRAETQPLDPPTFIVARPTSGGTGAEA